MDELDRPKALVELDAVIAKVATADDPYVVVVSELCGCALEATSTSEIAYRLYRLWAELSDWQELRPESKPEADAAMRRAATEWVAVKDDATARDRYLDHWLDDVLGGERPIG